MRQRLSQAITPPVPPMPAAADAAALGRGVRSDSSGSWRDKNLPPLPGEMRGPPGEVRPRTLFGVGGMPGAGAGDELGYGAPAPMEGHRSPSGRRQSFPGLGAGELRPNARTPTMPEQQGQPQGTSSKRKSKFLGALLGRVEYEHEVGGAAHVRVAREGGELEAQEAQGAVERHHDRDPRRALRRGRCCGRPAMTRRRWRGRWSPSSTPGRR